MNEQNYPFRNLSLEDLPGEQWKDVPKLEGHYKVSNLGRVRRLEWKGKNKKGYSHFKPEMIISPITTGSWNAYTKDYKKTIRVALVKDKERHNFILGRLVYYCFVEEFDLKAKNLYVLPKDGDNLNVIAENLVLGTPRDKSLIMEAAGRRPSAMVLSPEKRKMVQEKINAIKAERGVYRISRYSLTGKLIETYSNATLAAKAMKTSRGHLSKACQGRDKNLTACGYLWRRGNAQEIDISGLLKVRWFGNSPLARQQKSIGQYNLQGELLNTYSSIREAAKAMNTHPNNIQKVLSNRRLTCAGFLWGRGVKKKIQVLPKISATRKVSQYDLDGKWVKTHNSIAEAAKATKVDESDIGRVVSEKAMSAGGFLWRKGEDLRININNLRKHPHFTRSVLEKHMRKKREKNLELKVLEMEEQ